MPRYQLKNKCLFVDAYLYDEDNRKPTSNKKPDVIGSPHVLDQSTTPGTALKLNDAAAFIARFIVLGVDTDLISQIVTSEYPGDVVNAAQEVAEVYNMLTPYLEVRTYQRIHGAPKSKGKQNHQGGYTLDFTVNWFGTGGFMKGPL
jgi:hypothetical protein